MRPPPLELREFKPSDPVELDREELEALRRLIRGISITPAPGEELDRFIVNPGGVVGVGEIGDRQVIVRPKLDVRRLMFLISYSLAPTRWEQTLEGFDPAGDVYESVIPGFVAAVFRATKRGVLRGYHPRAEALATIRGRIDFDQLIERRFGVAPPIDCLYDEYSEDVEENQLLLAAAECLMSLRRVNPTLRKQLRWVRSLFSAVSRHRYAPRSVPVVPYTRLTEHYRPAVELARLILRNFSVEVGRGQSARGFFIDTAPMFEDFLVIALREALGLSERAFPQGAHEHSLYLDDRGRVRLEPDLSWWQEGACLFVGDAKYKRTPQVSGVKNPDIYQLLAYTQATGLETGMLIYAAGEAPEASYRIAQSQKVLEVRTLDLDQEPADLLRAVDRMALRIRAMRNSKPTTRRLLEAA